MEYTWYDSVMDEAHPFWNLAGLTDAALLGGLSKLVGSGRQLLAEVVAHLGEVEDRRLHLDAGHGSMFSYCLTRLGLSEDEACRRIKIARLARRHTGIYPRLASGQLSLSVVALLEPHLSNSNSEELLNLVSRKSVAQARELLASRFPRPDVPSTIRKLPSEQLAAPGTDGHDATLPLLGSARAATTAPTTPPITPAPPVREVPPAPPAKASRVIEPLSEARYKIQLTADSALKDKLELARDLMRHTQPDGDFAAILTRALDLLIEQLMKRKFGGRSKRQAQRIDPGRRAFPQSSPTPTPATPWPTASAPSSTTTMHTASASTHAPVATIDTRTQPTRGISRSTRRTVSERDGLRCTWQSPDGIRCESRAWLENDHADPRGRGGSSEPENIRLLCRAHNQRAAELHYGRKHMTEAVTRARQRRSATQTPHVRPTP
jgi:hypothetical protein